MFNSLNKGISTTKGVLIIVLVATIAGTGILAYQYFRPIEEIETPISLSFKDETASWTTYVNEEGKYKISYPPNYFIIPGLSTQDENEIVITEKDEEIFGEFTLHIFKKDYLTTEKVIFEECLDIQRQILKEEGNFEEKKVIIAGEEGVKMTLTNWTSCPQGYTKEITCRALVTSWMKAGNFYSFKGTLYGEDNFDAFLETNNQILSTFRVISEEENDWRSYWKTYKNEKYGFEIKYPQEYFPEDEKETFIVFSIPETTSPFLIINILNNPKNYTLEKFYNFYGLSENKELSEEEVGKPVYDYFKNSYSIESIEVNGIPAKKFLVGSYQAMVISISYNNKIFEIITTYPKQEEIFNRILSTFRFLD